MNVGLFNITQGITKKQEKVMENLKKKRCTGKKFGTGKPVESVLRQDESLWLERFVKK